MFRPHGGRRAQKPLLTGAPMRRREAKRPEAAPGV